MRYRNVKTGSIIDVPSVLRGNWEPVDKPKEEPAQKKTTRRRTTKKKTETAET